MSLHLSGTVFLIHNLVCALFHILLQWRLWPTHVFYCLCDCRKTSTHHRIHVCMSSFITFLFPGTQSICLLLSRCRLMSRSTKLPDMNMCWRRSLSLTIPLFLGAGERQRNQGCRWPAILLSDKQCTTGISALFISQLFALALHTWVSLLGFSAAPRSGFKQKCSSNLPTTPNPSTLSVPPLWSNSSPTVE